MMEQLGHLPPTPRAMFRMLSWRLTGRARRAEVDVAAIGERAAALMADRLAHETSNDTGKPGLQKETRTCVSDTRGKHNRL